MDVPSNGPPQRYAGEWAKPISAFHVTPGTDGGDAGSVEGKQIYGPMQGFGKLWQKTYRVRLEGADTTPQEVIATWKTEFGSFWPDNNRFHAPLAGITPGEVALISGKMPGGLTLSTGVYVIYSDDVSFSYMNPQGHPWAGMITFSADREPDGVTAAQVQLFIRAQDFLIELGMAFGGHRVEDKIWIHTLSSVARHFGQEDPTVTKDIVCVDKKRQWNNFGNIKHNAGLYAMTKPFRRKRGPAAPGP